MPGIRKINVPDVARLPAFCHATVAGDQVFVSGMLGARPGGLQLVDGGTGAQTTQALRNIETVLAACGCSLADVAKVNVYLTDMDTFGEMNDAYLGVFGNDPPARITVGCNGLALGAAVEMDCIAFVPPGHEHWLTPLSDDNARAEGPTSHPSHMRTAPARTTMIT